MLVAAGAALGVTRIGRGSIDGAMPILGAANPAWVLLAVLGFAIALLCSTAAWQAGLRACGGTAGFVEVSARSAIGSLVNSLAPAHLGGAVRVGLLSRTLPGADRLWRAGGVGAAVGAARTVVLAILVVAAAATSRLPMWPAPLLACAALCVLLICTRASKRTAGRVASSLQIFRSCAGSPRTALQLFGWVGCSVAVRLGATIAVATALGVPRPVPVAVVLLGAVALAGIVPLTPGNLGAGAGAATLALHGSGVPVGTALALGIAFQAIETFSGMTLGLAGAAVIAAPGTRVRRWSFAAAAAAAVLVAASLGVVAVDFV